MTNSTDRLDRIEALLQRSIITSDERMTRLEQAVAEDRRQTTLSIQNLSATVNQLSATVNQLSATVNQLSATVNQLAVEAREDRVVMHEVIDQLVSLREDNQRILNYLFGQQRGNGHGEQPE